MEKTSPKAQLEHTTKYLEFWLVHDTGKTKVWDILATNGLVYLGTIKWYPRWRQYTFFPQTETVWNIDCLNDVIMFIKKQMDMRRKKK